ncbi:MAG: 2-C-methyl-D-erythritol 4-phosphate cytidylyltransferase [Sphingobacteriales bacterium 50-39]|nr:2-C-methyl-D-erythritol 4-phosphate cytidylyltransferase [Sphingobacteriales bacterium]OJW57684.1 MAG: 2-C-methyl-D-erythritol 4-phosphate cytidylyltransferase [Sphingobacteriales bacterium 50-39]
MKKYAVIVAGGSGQRMGTQVPKQFLLLHGKPVLWYTLKIFLEAYEDMDIILVAPEEHMETARTMVHATGAAHRIRTVAGGATRFHSVYNGLQIIRSSAGGRDDGAEREEAVVFVHDGVRCLLSAELVHSCYEQAVRLGSAIPVVDSKDSIRVVTGEESVSVDRSRVKLVQTPQTFLSSVLLPAYSQPYQESFTDEASVVEANGGKVSLIEGEANNIKITTPTDLIVAGRIIEGGVGG